AIACARRAGGWSSTPCLVLVARTGSAAADAITTAFPEAREEIAPAGRRSAWIVPLAGPLAPAIEPLLRTMAAATPPEHVPPAAPQSERSESRSLLSLATDPSS